MMAKKQSDYLAALLAEEGDPVAPVVYKSLPEGPAPSPAPSPTAPPSAARAGMSLLGRESALARAASGEVRQVTQLMLDPARVRIWAGNARLQARLSEDSVRDLIDSIIAEGGQKVPAIVRRINDDPAFDYEVIAGTRRHFAISWLRANNYPDMKLVAQVAELDDEAAFRLADLENRARKDVSDFERARNYATALHSHYGGKQRRMAERLNLHESWLSRMLKVASLPDALVALFDDVNDIALRAAYPLAVYCSDSGNRGLAIDRGHKIEDIQAGRRATGKPPLAGNDIIRQLMKGLDSAAAPTLFEAPGLHGRPMLSITSRTRQGLTVKLHAGAGANRAALVAAFDQMLGALEEEGRGLPL